MGIKNQCWIISTKIDNNSRKAAVIVFYASTFSHNDALEDELVLCGVALRITVAAYAQAAVFLSSQGGGITTIETRRSVGE